MADGHDHSHIDVLVVGGGPAGLAAAIALRRHGVAHVVVVEREGQAGGTPRHTAHTGFGMRDLHRLLSGPVYAARYVELAAEAGVDVQAGTSVTGWVGPRAVEVTAPGGRHTLGARAIVLATGCRERPRSARLVPGSRPHGVLTTGALQQLVYLRHQPVGRRAVIVGAEHVSFSAVVTLAHGGARTLAIVTDQPRHQTYAALAWVTAGWRRVPLRTSSVVTAILGTRRVEAVEVVERTSGRTERIACDTVVFTGDWIPDSELARAAGLDFDAALRAPRVDGKLRTSVPGVFAAGNLVHAAERADLAALSGRHVAGAVHAFLESGAWPQRRVPIVCAPPFAWVSPSAVEPERGAVPHARFLSRVSELRGASTVEVRQEDRVLWRQRYRALVPARSIPIDAGWVRAVDPEGGMVSFGIVS